jgi:hypothetical protein
MTATGRLIRTGTLLACCTTALAGFSQPKDSTPYWQVFTCRYQAPAELAEAGFAPVARGAATALYDNLRVSVFEGTDFAIFRETTAR